MKVLSTLSYNVRGLASRQRRVNAHLLLASVRARPDVICLQEHKLRAWRLHRIKKEVWPAAHWNCAPAAEGVHAARNPGVEAGRGDVALCVSIELSNYITNEGISLCNRAAWICCSHLIWGRIGFIGVCGPNSTEERIVLWRFLIFNLDPSYRWMMLGDFNLIDATSDQWGGTLNTVAGQERGAWAQLLRKFQFKDTFSPRNGHLKFSWDSLQVHRHNPVNSSLPPNHRTLRRIDRIYWAKSNTGPTIECSSTILPGFAFSDHAPVWANLKVGRPERRPSRFRMNTSHFTDELYKARITLMWEAGILRGEARGWSPTNILKACTKEAGIIDRCWGKRKARERRIRLESLQDGLTCAQLRFEEDPSNAESQMKVLEAREHLLGFCANQAKWTDYVIQSKWLAEGDRGTKIFYKTFKSMATEKEIHELFSPEGLVETTWEGMAKIATDYFSTNLGINQSGTSHISDPELIQEVL